MRALEYFGGGRDRTPVRAAPSTPSFDGHALQVLESWASSTADGIEKAGHSFETYVREGYKANGVVFAVILARLLLFTEARFAFRSRVGGRPGELSSGPGLALLDTPWPNGTTGSLLARMEQDVSLSGNFFAWRSGPRSLRRLRPDWVEILAGTDGDDADALDAELLGYLYHPGGRSSGRAKGEFLAPGEVVHWAPLPDPTSNYRGMSWLTAVAREIDADSSMTDHKSRFFEHAATPNMLVKVAGELSDGAYKRLEAAIAQRHEGVTNAYRTMLLEAGADATVVGHSFEQMAFKAVQGAGETRIAAAGGVPPVIVGLSEGLAAATYSNYHQARRRMADMTTRPHWRSAAAALAHVVDVPPNTELWYDDRDIPALQDDAKDDAEIKRTQAETIGSLIRSGYEPDSAAAAILSGDFRVLRHTGKLPVTLYPDGDDPAAANQE